jgi:hypothetical protein
MTEQKLRPIFDIRCLSVIPLFFFIADRTPAISADPPADQLSTRVTLTQDTLRRWHLTANQATWQQIFAVLERRLRIGIHPSRLPQHPVSVACRERDLTRLIRCLVPAETNTAFHVPRNITSRNAIQVWIVGPNDRSHVFANHSPAMSKTAMIGPSSEPLPENAQAITNAIVVLTEAELSTLLKMTQAEDAEARAQALSRLALSGKSTDKTIRVAFETGFSDQNPKVRAQAVYGLTRLNNPQARTFLQYAVHDHDPSVRLMAVDSAGTLPQARVILQQALQDPDLTVRAAAAIRLAKAVP